MIPPELFSEAVQAFLKAHQSAPLAQTALAAGRFSLDLRQWVMAQLKGRELAKRKWPEWADKGLIYPPGPVVEQASSTATARYKLRFFEGEMRVIDLTAGLGIDTFVLAEAGKHVVAGEPDADRVACLVHNAERLGLSDRVQVIEGTAEDVLPTLGQAVVLLLDPDRRVEGKRVVDWSDTVPDPVGLLLYELNWSRALVKGSPMLDIEAGRLGLPGCRAVHVVEQGGEVKELLFDLELREGAATDAILVGDLAFSTAYEKSLVPRLSEAKTYLFDPTPGLRKAGCWKSLGEQLELPQLHPNSHLYTSEVDRPDFPGRRFRVLEELPWKKKDVLAALPEGRANLIVRGLSESTEEIRKRLSVPEGGEAYLLACQDVTGRRLLRCERLDLTN